MAMGGKKMRQPPTFDELHTARPYSEWHEDFGPVLWHLMPIHEPPHCGTPDGSEWPYCVEDETRLWWTPLPDCNLIQERWTIARKEPAE